MPNVRSGKTRAVATAGAKRSPTLPEVPTVAESGLPGYEFATWLGIVAPAGTPPAVVSKINSELVRVMAQRAQPGGEAIRAVQGIDLSRGDASDELEQLVEVRVVADRKRGVAARQSPAIQRPSRHRRSTAALEGADHMAG